MRSIMQNEKRCYLTGAEGIPLHKHHIFGGPNRRISEANGFWIYLVPRLHNMSNEGVHFNRDLDLKIKRECQRRFEEAHTREDFIRLIGRSYL